MWLLPWLPEVLYVKMLLKVPTTIWTFGLLPLQMPATELIICLSVALTFLHV